MSEKAGRKTSTSAVRKSGAIQPAEANDYPALLAEVKERIQSAQYTALRAVNKELVGLYWDIGQLIVQRQQDEGWGKAVVAQLAADLQSAFPGTSGFSASNLWRMKAFFETYHDAPKLARVVREVGRTLNLLIQEHCKAKNRTIVEYALRDARKPISVATYEVTRTLPKQLKGQLPSPDAIARVLEGI